MAQVIKIPGLGSQLQELVDNPNAADPDGVRRTYAELVFDRTYRGTLVEASVRIANTGTPGVKYTIEVTGDNTGSQEFVGNRVWSAVYLSGHLFQTKQLSDLAESNGKRLAGDELSDDLVSSALVGGKIVFTLKPGNDPRYPDIRYFNIDKGQAITAPKPFVPKGGSASSADLTAVVSIPNVVGTTAPAQVAPQPAVAAPLAVVQPAVIQQPSPVQEVSQATAPADTGVRLPGGIRLPGQ